VSADSCSRGKSRACTNQRPPQPYSVLRWDYRCRRVSDRHRLPRQSFSFTAHHAHAFVLLGHSQRDRGACLNHKLPGLEGKYNTHDYFAERKAALETWTALLLEIERGERKVTPMRSRRSNP
jgi:hypothetical protein